MENFVEKHPEVFYLPLFSNNIKSDLLIMIKKSSKKI